MPNAKRAKPTPSAVSDDVTALLRREVIRLRKVQRASKKGLNELEIGRLLAIGTAMRELEDNRMGALVAILGHRFKARDVPDEVLQPLLDAMTGSKAGGE